MFLSHPPCPSNVAVCAELLAQRVAQPQPHHPQAALRPAPAPLQQAPGAPLQQAATATRPQPQLHGVQVSWKIVLVVNKYFFTNFVFRSSKSFSQGRPPATIGPGPQSRTPLPMQQQVSRVGHTSHLMEAALLFLLTGCLIKLPQKLKQ